MSAPRDAEVRACASALAARSADLDGASLAACSHPARTKQAAIDAARTARVGMRPDGRIACDLTSSASSIGWLRCGVDQFTTSARSELEALRASALAGGGEQGVYGAGVAEDLARPDGGISVLADRRGELLELGAVRVGRLEVLC